MLELKLIKIKLEIHKYVIIKIKRHMFRINFKYYIIISKINLIGKNGKSITQILCKKNFLHNYNKKYKNKLLNQNLSRTTKDKLLNLDID